TIPGRETSSAGNRNSLTGTDFAADSRSPSSGFPTPRIRRATTPIATLSEADGPHVKAALVGLGRMGLRHLQVLKDLNLDVVGASDVQEAARAKAGADFGLSSSALFTDARDMIERTKPELVVVATTAPSHAEIVCLAARKGARAILCEKPMATSLADCDRMIDVCATSGTRLAVNHQMRFMEQYTKPKALIEDEAFGGLGSVSVVAGNFGMAMNGSHYFEMFRYLTDEMPATVSAWFSSETVPNPRGAQFEDRAGTVR